MEVTRKPVGSPLSGSAWPPYVQVNWNENLSKILVHLCNSRKY